jgi:RHS repeat-associated protein
MGTNDGKATIKTYDYTPYGEMYFESGWAKTNFRFTGAFWDGTTQMYYFPFRDYSPGVARWLTRDPLGQDAGINLYTYVGGNPVDLIDPLGLDWLDDLSNFSAGFGDTISFGITGKIRRLLGYDDVVDKCSGWYKGGEWAGVAHSIALGAAGGLRAAGTKGFAKEFSHFWPDRWKGPVTFWNGNYRTIVQHALSDASKHRFMSRPWKALHPLPSHLVRFWRRFPRLPMGTAAGAGYGFGGMSVNDCWNELSSR